MTAFDAPRDDESLWHSAASAVVGRFGVVVASVMTAGTIVFVALSVLLAAEEVRYRADLAADDIHASVFLRSQTPRADAEALKGQLVALPFVRDATLRTKDDALIALARDLPQVRRANPLPDVWAITMGFGGAEATPALSDRVSAARESLARLPDVESVDVDVAWVALLASWQARLSRTLSIGNALLPGVAALLLVCLFFLTGRSLSGQPSEFGAGRSAVVVVAIGVGFASLLVAATWAVGIAAFAESAGLDWKPIAMRLGHTSFVSIAGLSVGTLVLATSVISLAVRKR